VNLRKSILFILSLLITTASFAGNWKFRAREHFENFKFEGTTQNYSFKGYTNTLNWWYEEAEKYSIGLALSPIFGNLSAGDLLSKQTLGNKITVQNIGIEFKYFPIKKLKLLYTRIGLYQHTLKSELDDESSMGFLYGIGYEIPYKKVNFALEIGRRSINFDDLKATATSIALGVHFYRK
jgi:hypothetical protein